jgi:2-polyprenyl-3-methyl-5-hydroxy-6-metoxy-1,4-benzoquinol methylase
MSGLVRDRIEAIRPYVEARSVLDVGCVDARTQREGSAERIERKPDPLFRRLTELNAETLGVDIDADGVDRLRHMGFRVQCADAQTMELGRRFDTIVAGEVIEHLENPGAFLRNLRRHLWDDGILLLSTPNAFAARSLWKILRYGRPSVHEDHTCWFDPLTLGQLLRRTGFAPVAGHWVESPHFRLRAWPRYLRQYFSRSFLLVARPVA